MADPVKALAEYLTNNLRVVQTSIGLQVGGQRAAEARAFYALRDAFGVRGYCDANEAEVSIKKAIRP